MKESRVALLVHACDRYEFLYRGFELFFSKYWDKEINCNLYFATEVIDAAVPGFTNVKSGRGEWADRLAILLREKVKEDYVLYFQEDMWLKAGVNGKLFNQLFDVATSKNWSQVKLHSSEVYKTKPTALFIEGFNVAELDNEASGYLMSHQVTLWRKDVLIAQLHRNEHPWRNERNATRRMRKLNPVIQHVDCFAENGKPAINANQAPVGRSEYHTISVNGMLNDNVVPFIRELENGNEAEKKYAGALRNHYENKLTHDGKPKPRKEDLFKRMTKWLRRK